jgi:plasmid stabilization system protein ParE
MAYKIVWTEKANIERLRILQFWIDNNKSRVFSLKLDKLFISAIRDLSKKPAIGRKTEFENVRVKIVREYLIFYEIVSQDLVILSVWDGRRHKKTLKIR